MPTEHEYKYVISSKLLNEFSESILGSLANKVYLIQQGYLCQGKGVSCRIRSLTDVATKRTKWFMTFKQKVDDRVIEVEKKVSIRDGKDLWKVAINKLNKTRHVFVHENNQWELDLFKADVDVYFILAEVELDEGKSRPKKMPVFMKKYLLLEVDLDDDRFANKYLGDQEYVKNLYQDVLSGKR